MIIIRDYNGNEICRTHGLLGLRRYTVDHNPKLVAIDKIADTNGKLSILFEDKSSCETNVISFEDLKLVIYNWTELYGCSLLINTVFSGKINKDNLILKEAYK
jgi:hypothetical protein